VSVCLVQWTAAGRRGRRGLRVVETVVVIVVDTVTILDLQAPPVGSVLAPMSTRSSARPSIIVQTAHHYYTVRLAVHRLLRPNSTGPVSS